MPKQLLIYIFFILLLDSAVITQRAAVAQATVNCEEELQEADKNWRTGNFDAAISILSNCLGKEGLAESERLKAYRLLGLVYISQDYLNDAKKAVEKLLDLVPDYEPDPVQDPPMFAKLVAELKEARMKAEEKPVEIQEPEKTEESAETLQPDEDYLTELVREEEKGSSTKWWLLGGGISLVGGVAALVLLGGNGDKPLAAPPGLPPTN